MTKVYAIAILLLRFSPSFIVIHTPVSFNRNCDTTMETSEYGVACIAIIIITMITTILSSFLSSSIFRRRSLPLSLPSHAREFEPSARKVAARSDITLMSRLLTTPSLATVIVDAYTRGYENRSFVHDWKGGVILVSQYTTYTFSIDRRKIEIHRHSFGIILCLDLRGNRLELFLIGVEPGKLNLSKGYLFKLFSRSLITIY